jgi:hypothetical protein
LPGGLPGIAWLVSTPRICAFSKDLQALTTAGGIMMHQNSNFEASCCSNRVVCERFAGDAVRSDRGKATTARARQRRRLTDLMVLT